MDKTLVKVLWEGPGWYRVSSGWGIVTVLPDTVAETGVFRWFDTLDALRERYSDCAVAVQDMTRPDEDGNVRCVI